MKGKFIAVGIILLFILTSFGAVGTNLKKSEDFEIEYYRQKAKENAWTFDIGLTSKSGYEIDDLCKFRAPENWQDFSEFYDIEPSSSFGTYFDWRDQGAVTEVKDQGSCGSCWAFATVAPLESAIRINEGRIVDLSEQWLVSCNTNGYGCNGGWWAHDYHEWKKGACGGFGAVLEEDFSYEAIKKPCNGHYEHPYILNNWAFIGSESAIPDTSKIKQAILDYGPVSAAVRTTDSWRYYTGGVFNDHSPGSINHAVTIVGWDDDLGSNGCWIIKNSWSRDWGENGFMYIEYGCSSIGYSACFVDGYRGPATEIEETVTVHIKRINNNPSGGYDAIDGTNLIPLEPEWYYRLGLESSEGINKQFAYNMNLDNWWIFQWISGYDWQPNNEHQTIIKKQDIDFSIKLMDDDFWPNPDDLADISQEPGGGIDQDTPDHRPSIYHGTYNLLTGKITGDDTSKDGSYYTTVGDGINNAKVWFKVTDSYNEELYEPDLSVDKSKITDFTGSGDVKTANFRITNDAEYDNNEWLILDWSGTDDKSWISFSPRSGTLNGGISKTVTVTVDTSDLSKGKHTGKISISSNGGSKDITVEIEKKGTAKSNNNFIFYKLLSLFNLENILNRLLEIKLL